MKEALVGIGRKVTRLKFEREASFDVARYQGSAISRLLSINVD